MELPRDAAEKGFMSIKGKQFSPTILNKIDRMPMEDSPSSQDSCSSGEASTVFAQKKLLKAKPTWKILTTLFKMQTFEEYFNYSLSYEWCMGFLIKGRK